MNIVDYTSEIARMWPDYDRNENTEAVLNFSLNVQKLIRACDIQCPSIVLRHLDNPLKYIGKVSLPAKRELPKASGVYFVLIRKDVVYIGRSNDIRQRWVSHHRLPSLEELGNDVDIFWMLFPEQNLFALEYFFINLFKPVVNFTPHQNKSLPKESMSKSKKYQGKHTITFVVDGERDDDILQWYYSLEAGERSKSVRDMIRMGFGHSGESNQPAVIDDIRDMFDEFKQELRTVFRSYRQAARS